MPFGFRSPQLSRLPRPQQALRDPDIAAGTPGFYLDFEIAPGSESAAQQLENRPKHIELVSVHERTENEPSRATVFVPEAARDHFFEKSGTVSG